MVFICVVLKFWLFLYFQSLIKAFFIDEGIIQKP